MNESIREFVTQLTNEQLFAVWFLIGAALVFWMQAGFAMVEAGFTRAKNTGNIIMKNLMDFCIGTVTFILIGFGLLMGEDLVGIIGKPGTSLPLTQTSTFQALYLTSYSAPPPLRSFRALWRSVQSSCPTAYIRA